MKIAVDISDLSTGRADGTTRYTYELARRLPQLAPTDTWQFLAPSAPIAPYVLAPDSHQLRLSPWPKYWTQSRLPFELYRDRSDVLFMPIQQLPYLRPRRLKTVAVIHDLAVHKYPTQFTYKDWLLLHVFSAYVARTADEIIAVSQATATDIATYYGRTANVHVVHHGVDHAHFTPPHDEAARQTSWHTLQRAYPRLRQPYLFYVGQLQPRKNLSRLIEAFELRGQQEPELSLVIAGSHGWLNEPIRERARSSRFSDRIHLIGRVPDDILPALYWHADVFVLPSLYEGFGLPVLEAMAAGCPVVTSNTSSLPEIVGGAGVLIDPLDVTSIAHGIEQAQANREQLQLQGIARAQTFSWDTTAAQTLAIIK